MSLRSYGDVTFISHPTHHEIRRVYQSVCGVCFLFGHYSLFFGNFDRFPARSWLSSRASMTICCALVHATRVLFRVRRANSITSFRMPILSVLRQATTNRNVITTIDSIACEFYSLDSVHVPKGRLCCSRILTTRSNDAHINAGHLFYLTCGMIQISLREAAIIAARHVHEHNWVESGRGVTLTSFS